MRLLCVNATPHSTELAEQETQMKFESITIKNIESAFAGESFAHIKYRYFVKEDFEMALLATQRDHK